MAKEKASKINWVKFWNRFDEWYNGKESNQCKECGHQPYDSEPEWEDQQKWIQREINRLANSPHSAGGDGR
jgi:hypothetical protein